MSATDHSSPSHIGQIAINPQDVDRATAFYRDVLGLRHLFRAGQLSFFDCGGVRLMLDKAEKPEFDHPSSVIYFQVADIQAAHQRMESAGAKFEDEPHLWRACPPRFVDDLLPRHRRQPPSPNERSNAPLLARQVSGPDSAEVSLDPSTYAASVHRNDPLPVQPSSATLAQARTMSERQSAHMPTVRAPRRNASVARNEGHKLNENPFRVPV